MATPDGTKLMNGASFTLALSSFSRWNVISHRRTLRPVLAGGAGTLKADRPDKTIGSFWPDLSTAFDYIKRAMPYGNARSLTDDDVYALTAYLLSMNDIVKDENFELSDKNFTSIKMPNAAAFYDDDRETAEKQFWKKDPCMKDCRAAPKVTGRAISVDVTPDSKAGPKVD